MRQHKKLRSALHSSTGGAADDAGKAEPRQPARDTSMSADVAGKRVHADSPPDCGAIDLEQQDAADAAIAARLQVSWQSLIESTVLGSICTGHVIIAVLNTRTNLRCYQARSWRVGTSDLSVVQGVLEPEPWEASCRATTGLAAAISGATCACRTSIC